MSTWSETVARVSRLFLTASGSRRGLPCGIVVDCHATNRASWARQRLPSRSHGNGTLSHQKFELRAALQSRSGRRFTPCASAYSAGSKRSRQLGKDSWTADCHRDASPLDEDPVRIPTGAFLSSGTAEILRCVQLPSSVAVPSCLALTARPFP